MKLSSKVSKIGPLDPEIWAKKFFENISRNMIVTEKMIMSNIIGNFVADKIVFGVEVLAHHPEELSLEI